MLKVNIIAVGSIKEKFFVDAINEYKKRLSRFCCLKIIEVEEESQKSIEKKIEIESRHLLENIKGYSILLDREGEMVSSEKLAKIIDSASSLGQGEVSLIIGGSNGVSQDIKKQVDKSISFGQITFPHQLFRVVLLEQVYRAFSINANTPYHK